MKMEVTFRYTDDDLRALLRQYPWYQRWEAMLHVVALTFVWMLLSSILPAILQYWLGLVICWAVVTIIVAVVVVLAAFGKPNIEAADLRPLTLRLLPSHRESALDVAEFHDTWSTMWKVEENDTHLFLFVDKWRVYVVPRTAFKSAEHAQDFATFARERTDAGSDTLPAELNEFVQQRNTESAEVIDLQFTPQMRELLQYDFHQLNPPDPQYGTWIGAIGVVALLGLMFSQMVDAGVGRVLYCAAAALASLTFVVILHGVIARWRWRRDFNTMRLEPLHLVVDENGIAGRSPTQYGCLRWRAVENLLEGKNFLVFATVHGVDDIVIPKRAIAEQDIARLRGLATRQLKALQPNEPPADTTIEPTPETGNPYQSPQQP